MFLGTIPPDVQQIVLQQVKTWPDAPIYVGCSGNFTVERTLYPLGRPLRGTDVTIYSCALGAFMGNGPTRLTVKPELMDEFGWLAPYLETPVGAAATVMLCTRMLDGYGRAVESPYYARIRTEYEKKWPILHAKTTEKLEGLPFRLQGFDTQDVYDWVDGLGKNHSIVSYPPFYGSGAYEKMFSKRFSLEKVFDWDKPEYQSLEGDRLLGYLEKVTKFKSWMFGTNLLLEEFASYRRGACQTTSRGAAINVYSSGGPVRIVVPAQDVKPLLVPRLGKEKIEKGRLSIIVLTKPQFSEIRSMYLNEKIKPAKASFTFGVLVNGKLIGCFALDYPNPTFGDFNSAYLLSDFAISGTGYPKLSKLVLYAILSKEMKLVMERCLRRRINLTVTSAFTKNPISMKYRGLFTLDSRKQEESGGWVVNYSSQVGRWTLREGLSLWKTKYGEYREGDNDGGQE
jgi:hypothetical protein